jgi:hypothetical protein
MRAGSTGRRQQSHQGGARRSTAAVKAAAERADGKRMTATGFRPARALRRFARAAPATPGHEYSHVETLLLLTAVLLFIDALIHIGAAVDHYGEFALYTAAFLGLAAGQMTLAALLLRRPDSRVLRWGCAFELTIVALWVASRTVGVPIAPKPWVPEQAGVADVIETAGECVTALTLISIALAPRSAIAAHVVRRLTPVLFAAILASVLYGTGAHAG